MSKLTKNQRLALEKIEAGKAYSLVEAAELVKEITSTKFDASVDIDVRLGVDPRKANQMVRGVVSLPHGTGKQVRVLALCTPDQEAAAKEAGADHVGLDEYIEKIKGGWTDVSAVFLLQHAVQYFSVQFIVIHDQYSLTFLFHRHPSCSHIILCRIIFYQLLFLPFHSISAALMKHCQKLKSSELKGIS